MITVSKGRGRVAWVAGVLAVVLAGLAGSARGEPRVSSLTADNLLLIVNRNEPAGRRLAEFYAEQRKVPAGRILELNLPRGEEVPAHIFASHAVPPIRAFLKENGLEEKVTCLVTFYGVPLRVAPRANTQPEAAEYRVASELLKAATEKARQAVASAEDVAKQANPDFAPANTSDELPALPLRADAAVRSALESLPADPDADRRAQRFSRLMAAVEQLYGPLETQERLLLPAYRRLSARAAPEAEQAARREKTAQLVAEVQALGRRAPADPDARARLRELFTTQLGALRSLQVLNEQKLRLETRETEAAVDSELACLWWPDTHLRYRWHENPLHYRIRFGPKQRILATGPGTDPATRRALVANLNFPKTLMVTRLDAPTEQLVRDLIATSVRVEAEGLKGVVALDARGKAPTDAYGKFDELLRNLASEVKTHTNLTVRLDDAEPVFAPAAVQDVALYCGWYSLRNYVPGLKFNPGAVGYHVASSEMVSLHHPNEKGWAANLLRAGVVATTGPVAEPYLHSFPLPTEFFPLLLTGELTLAEVYWLTNPLVSWMNTCVGDPLYRPFAARPAMNPMNVSHHLRVIFAGGGETRPAPAGEVTPVPGGE